MVKTSAVTEELVESRRAIESSEVPITVSMLNGRLVIEWTVVSDSWTWTWTMMSHLVIGQSVVSACTWSVCLC